MAAANRVFLLYLNKDTWLNAEGIELAEQVGVRVRVRDSARVRSRGKGGGQGSVRVRGRDRCCAAWIELADQVLILTLHLSLTSNPNPNQPNPDQPIRYPGAQGAQGRHHGPPRARERPSARRLRVRDLLPHDAGGLQRRSRVRVRVGIRVGARVGVRATARQGVSAARTTLRSTAWGQG